MHSDHGAYLPVRPAGERTHGGGGPLSQPSGSQLDSRREGKLGSFMKARTAGWVTTHVEVREMVSSGTASRTPVITLHLHALLGHVRDVCLAVLSACSL